MSSLGPAIEAVSLSINTEQNILRESALPNGILTSQRRVVNSAKPGGLVDPALGTNIDVYCTTCKDQGKCITHPTYVRLNNVYVIHPSFYSTVCTVLNCVCLHCGKILKDDIQKDLDEQIENLRNLPPRVRLSQLEHIVRKVKSCSKTGYGCSPDTPCFKVYKLKNGTFPLEYYELYYAGAKGKTEEVSAEGTGNTTNEPDEILDANSAFNILNKITNETWELMGFDSSFYRPEEMILNVLPVPPRSVRTTNDHDGTFVDDDLIIFLTNIIQKTEEIKLLQEKSPIQEKLNRATKLINYYITTMFNNTNPANKYRHKNSNNPLKSYHEKIDKKQGLIRRNMQGKRIGQSGRSVITGDPSISIDEISMPRIHAMTMDFPEVVTEENIEKLTMLVRNGSDIYPGANRVMKNNDKKSIITTRHAKNTIELKVGDTVYRHLQSGDYVLLNRQPSLHKDSIQCHKVVVKNQGRTIGLSVISTKPYNADFDKIGSN